MTDEVIGGPIAKRPIGRLGQPDEAGDLIAWLVTQAPDFVNGAYIPIDGGYLTQ